MNEFTLNALINLFAIFSVLSRSGKDHAREAFSNYLKLHLGLSSPNEYTRLFDELIELYGIDGMPMLEIDMEAQAKKIASNLKSRLQHKDQLMAVLRFIELSRLGDPDKARPLISILAEAFSISSEDIEKFRQFIFFHTQFAVRPADFLLLSACSPDDENHIRHIRRTPFEGEILFFYLQAAGHYLFIFKGKENVFIEGNPILPDRFYAFKEGSILRGPRIAPVYYSDVAAGFSEASRHPVFTFSARDIEYRFKNSTNGLYPFSFKERSGQLIAIMGGSGVGKTTLLNILSGITPPCRGHLFVNELDLHQDKKQMEGIIGYVPQDDLLFEELSVWENLVFNARLCLEGYSEAQIGIRVEEVLRELELLECKDLKVGSPLKKFISGGQRKRLNVALELIREPAILFLDEPTSGLSSIDSEKVLLLLKEQARKGRIIICNLHQPSSAMFKLLDKLWILDKGGRPVYAGNPLDAVLYFRAAIGHVNAEECQCRHCGNVNPEQLLEIIETKKIDASGQLTAGRLFSPEEWYRRYKSDIEPACLTPVVSAHNLPRRAFKKPEPAKQFSIFFSRNVRVKVSDKQYLLVNLLEAPMLAVIVAWFTRFSEGGNYILLENKNLISYLFMSIVVVLFIGMSVSAQEIVKDRNILKREAFLNLSRFSYLNSKISFLLLLSAFQTLVFVLIGNHILEIQGMNLTFWLVLFSVAVFSNMLGLNISSALDSMIAIYVLIPLLLIPQILLCGIIVRFDDLQNKERDRDAIPIVGELMVSRWAYEAMAVGQFSGNRYMVHFFDIDKQMSRTRYLSDLLLTELSGRIDHIGGMIQTEQAEEAITAKLKIVRNEMDKLNRVHGLPAFPGNEHLVMPRFTDEVAEAARLYLTRQKDSLNLVNNRLRDQKDRMIREIEAQGKGSLFSLKRQHHNKAIEELVMNTASKEYIRETRNGIMQKIAPVYKKPDYNNGRAHFLSSEKHLAGMVFHTVPFNLAVIWLMIAVLYLTLYYDWIRKLIRLRGRD
jgi:ABC transport system ATP-binding/permease protein